MRKERRRENYLLLNIILVKYLEKAFVNNEVAPRYLELDTIEDIVRPFYEIKPLIQRVEWLKGAEHVQEVLRFMVANQMSAEELTWAVDMFALNKKDVLNRIRTGA